MQVQWLQCKPEISEGFFMVFPIFSPDVPLSSSFWEHFEASKAKRYETERRIQNKSTYWFLGKAWSLKEFIGHPNRHPNHIRNTAKCFAYEPGSRVLVILQQQRLIFELTWRDFFIYMAWSQGLLPPAYLKCNNRTSRVPCHPAVSVVVVDAMGIVN